MEEGKLLNPEEAIRLRIALRERRRARLASEAKLAREGLRATLSAEVVAEDPVDQGSTEQTAELFPESAPAAETESPVEETVALDVTEDVADSEPVPVKAPAEDLAALKAGQLKKRLAQRGISFPENASKADLIELLTQAGD
jgi:hypothetical protein